MNRSQPKLLVLIASVFWSITGFGDFFFKEDVFENTKETLTNIKQTTKPSAEITGLQTKELVKYVPYHLINTEKDPFTVKSFVREVGQGQLVEDSDACRSDDCGDGPPIPHSPFFLESYGLDQLTMTGTMSNSNKGKVALIMTPDSGIVYATVGEYIGRQNGLIIAINREAVIIQEKYRTAQGWENRNATLPLIRN